MDILKYLAPQGHGGIIRTIAGNYKDEQEAENAQFAKMQDSFRNQALINALKEAGPDKTKSMAALGDYASKGGDPTKFGGLLDFNKAPTLPSSIQEADLLGVPRDKQRELYIQGKMPKADDTLQEVYDPQSPTGTRFIPRAQAAGMYGKPPSSSNLQVGPDGTVSFTQGRGATVGGGLQKPTMNKVEERLMDFGDLKMQMNEVTSAYKPEYQTIGTRFGQGWYALKDKIDPEKLLPEERKSLEDFTNYRASAGQFFANKVKEMAGTAMTPAEAERQLTYIPDVGTGFFDGDSPSQAKTKIDRLTRNTNNAMARYHYIRNNGLSMESIPLENVPKLMRDKGSEIETELKAQGLSGDQLKEAVLERIYQEFGI